MGRKKNDDNAQRRKDRFSQILTAMSHRYGEYPAEALGIIFGGSRTTVANWMAGKNLPQNIDQILDDLEIAITEFEEEDPTKWKEVLERVAGPSQQIKLLKSPKWLFRPEQVFARESKIDGHSTVIVITKNARNILENSDITRILRENVKKNVQYIFIIRSGSETRSALNRALKKANDQAGKSIEEYRNRAIIENKYESGIEPIFIHRKSIIIPVPEDNRNDRHWQKLNHVLLFCKTLRENLADSLPDDAEGVEIETKDLAKLRGIEILDGYEELSSSVNYQTDEEGGWKQIKEDPSYYEGLIGEWSNMANKVGSDYTERDGGFIRFDRTLDARRWLDKNLNGVERVHNIVYRGLQGTGWEHHKEVMLTISQLVTTVIQGGGSWVDLALYNQDEFIHDTVKNFDKDLMEKYSARVIKYNVPVMQFMTLKYKKINL